MLYRVLWVACIIERDDALLLARRLKSMDYGILGPPGGSVEFGESLLAAAERECFEETGCVFQKARVIGFTDVDPRGLVALVSGELVGEPQCTEPTRQEPWRWVPRGPIGVQQGIRDYWSGSFIKCS